MNKNKIERFVFNVILGCFLWGFLLSETSALERPHGCCELVPAYWLPSLEQVEDYLNEASRAEAQAPQQTLNRMSQNLADIRDAQLFIVYIQLLQTLDDRGRAELFEEQQRWLGKRTEDAQAAVISKGGSLAPLEYNGAFKKITEERLAELQKRLQNPPYINHQQ